MSGKCSSYTAFGSVSRLFPNLQLGRKFSSDFCRPLPMLKNEAATQNYSPAITNLPLNDYQLKKRKTR